MPVTVEVIFRNENKFLFKFQTNKIPTFEEFYLYIE